MVDNFDIIREHLTFESDFDRYIVHIIKRPKDEEGRKYGANESNRLLKTFYINSLEYFDRKIPVIKDICDSNSARAYILPQVRDNKKCMIELAKLVLDNLDNPTQKPDHLIRSAYCGYHGSRDKKWILDLDNDNMTEYIYKVNYGGSTLRTREWTPDEVLKFVRQQLISVGKSVMDAYMIPTRNGHCIVTSPFNLKAAFDDCNMMFEGDSKRVTSVTRKENDFKESIMPYTDQPCYQQKHGWIIKDGMALLYFNKD